MQLDAYDIIRAMETGDFDANEVRLFYNAYKKAAANLARKNTFTMRRGMEVKFNGRGSVMWRGVIEDIKVKNVIVNVSGTRYRVPASMLVAA